MPYRAPCLEEGSIEDFLLIFSVLLGTGRQRAKIGRIYIAGLFVIRGLVNEKRSTVHVTAIEGIWTR
jgi:hypothetical protein